MYFAAMKNTLSVFTFFVVAQRIKITLPKSTLAFKKVDVILIFNATTILQQKGQ